MHRQTLLQLLVDPHEDEAAYLLHTCRDLGVAIVYILVGNSDSGSPQSSWIVDSVDHPVRFLSCQSPASFSEERECPGLLTGLWWILTHSGMLHPNLNKKHTHTQDAPLPSSTTPRTQTETWALTVRAPMDPHG